MKHYIIQVSVVVLLMALKSDAVCPDGWTDAEGYCYNFTAGLMLSWDEAQAFCAQTGGAHILVEVSADEHVAFVSYRQSLPQQGDPLWLGVHVVKQGSWSWVSDTGLSSQLYQNWKNGKFQTANLGQCVVSMEFNMTQMWQSWPCSNPLSFICEIAPRNTQTPGGGYTFTLADYFHDWKKVYEDSTFQLSNYVVNANMARTRSLVSCAVTCTTVAGCAAFNHQRSDNKCQFILSDVNNTYVSHLPGWDVWIDMTNVG